MASIRLLDHNRDEARAWIAEVISDPEAPADRDAEPYMALGLFNAHVEALDLPRGLISGPDRVSVDEALAWARPLAARIVVRVCAHAWDEMFYTAGDTPITTMNAPGGSRTALACPGALLRAAAGAGLRVPGSHGGGRSDPVGRRRHRPARMG